VQRESEGERRPRDLARHDQPADDAADVVDLVVATAHAQLRMGEEIAELEAHAPAACEAGRVVIAGRKVLDVGSDGARERRAARTEAERVRRIRARDRRRDERDAEHDERRA
jgi:hypothetical protein